MQLSGGRGSFRVLGLRPGVHNALLQARGIERMSVDLILPEGGDEALELDFTAARPARTEVRRR